MEDFTDLTISAKDLEVVELMVSGKLVIALDIEVSNHRVSYPL